MSQQIVKNPTIIECSRYEATIKPSDTNSSWTNDFPIPINLNKGDQLTVEKCFINSNLSDLSNIEIPEDTSLYFTFGYYDVNYTVNNKNEQPQDIDYDYYIAYNVQKGVSNDLISVSVRGEVPPTGGQQVELDLYLSFYTGDGTHHHYQWGGQNPDQPTVYFPKPPPGQTHSNLTVPINVQNVTVSTLQYTIETTYEDWLGPTWGPNNPKEIELIRGFKEVIIPAGEYTRSGLAKEITDQLQQSQPMFDSSQPQTGNDFLRLTSNIQNHYACEDKTGTVLTENFAILTGQYNTTQQVNVIGLINGMNITVQFYKINPDGSSEYKSFNTTINDISIDNNQAVIEFTDDVFENALTSNHIVIVSNIPSNQCQFIQCNNNPTGANTKKYDYTTNSYFGASEVVLLYDEDRNVFTWSYYHMPYYGGPAPEQIGIMQIESSVNNKFYTITQNSGIFWLDMQPRSFFENLGFNVEEQLLVPIQNNLSINRADLDSKITKGFPGLSSFVGNGDRTVNSITQAGLFIETTDTIEIVASNIDDNEGEEGGFYLLAISCTGDQGYYSHDGRFGTISAIVGKYNQIKDFVEGYSDISINYIAESNILIQNIKIDILDPKTKQPVGNLGENSSIFLRIDRA